MQDSFAGLLSSYQGCARLLWVSAPEVISVFGSAYNQTVLRSISFENFRCFQQHKVSFEKNTVVVGKNNAGKSSIVEGFELIAAVTNRHHATFVAPPAILELPDFEACFEVRAEDLRVSTGSVFHRYGEPPAVVAATFDGDITATAYVVSPDAVYGSVRAKRNWIRSASQLRDLALPRIHVLPQISPLESNEKRKNEDYVADHLFSDRSSRHFRNQLWRLHEEFAEFKRLAEATWPGLAVEPVEHRTNSKGTLLWMPVRDGDFVGEIGLMGHGLQMWLQMIWFVSRVSTHAIVVLDEPDVYMHPDLQRKLFRLVRNRFQQAVVATHSIEIMAEADPSEILIVDKKRRVSRFANTEPALQLLIEQLGGVHNVHLARLWSARKFLLVEGKDIALLRRIHAILFPEADLPIDAMPNFSIGGWSGWPRAIGSSLVVKNTVGDRVVTYCILDRDYHTESEIEERMAEAKRAGVNLHVWSRKEIENYLVDPSAIRRAMARRCKQPPTVEEIWAQILEICEHLKLAVIDGVASEIQRRDRSIDLVGANKRARANVGDRWTDPKKRVAIVSGKELLSRVSDWAQKNWRAGFGPGSVASGMTRLEVPREVKELLEAIESGKEL